MVIFKLNNGGIIKVNSYSFIDDGYVTFDNVSNETIKLISEQRVTGGITALGVMPDGQYVGIASDVRFALESIGLGYEISGVFISPNEKFDKSIEY